MQELKRKKYFIKLELELELNENDTGLCSVAHISIEWRHRTQNVPSNANAASCFLHSERTLAGRILCVSAFLDDNYISGIIAAKSTISINVLSS